MRGGWSSPTPYTPMDARGQGSGDKNRFSYFSTKTYVVAYSKEPSQCNGSFNNQKQMFKLMNKKAFTILCPFFVLTHISQMEFPIIIIWTSPFPF